MAAQSALVDEMIRLVTATETEVTDLKKATNTVARKAGIPEPYPNVSTEPTGPVGGTVAIRPDQFVSFTAPSTAAREYLNLRGQARGAATIEEIFDALNKGGFAFNNKMDSEAKGGLKVALAKDVNVYKIANGTYGLTAWYPNARKDKSGGTKKGDPAATDAQDGQMFSQEETGEEGEGAEK